MSLFIKKPGILTTVQDLGRHGTTRFGINPGGVMDTAAARIVNILAGNDDADAVLEMHFPAAEIEFEHDSLIALGGADFDARLDGNPTPNWTCTTVSKGSLLKFARRRSGNRAYLAVKDGFHVDPWLGSASTNLVAGIGGFAGRKLASGDRLECDTPSERGSVTAGRSIVPHYSRFGTVRILAGNEFEYLTATSERLLVRSGFTLTNDCDRMGYRLNGKPIHLLHDLRMVSSAVTAGTLQLLPDGQLIVLMADHQTSGGYPRIGTVIPVDLPILAQCGPGDGVSFEFVTIGEAERLSLRFETELNFLRVGCRLQNQNAKY